jgi:hypothetical protein
LNFVPPVAIVKEEGTMNIELSPQEKSLLTELLEHEVEDVRTEIRHTQNYDVKLSLENREKVVRELLNKVSG